MSLRHRRRIGAPILALSAALLVPAAAQAAPPPFPPNVIIGTADPEPLAGGPRADMIFGLGGDDLIYGAAGADRIFGGRGADRIRGGPGPDTIRGGQDADRIAGGSGNDLIIVSGDGAIDTVLCGDGRWDLAIVDPDDVVANDCEFVWTRDPEG